MLYCFSSHAELDRGNMNCEPLDDKLQIAWEMKGDMIEFELAGIIGTQKITIAVM